MVYSSHTLLQKDNLALPYTNCHLQSVFYTRVSHLVYSGAFDFKNGTTIATEYVYDGCGSLTQDKNKGIALIDYDYNGMPTRIQFRNGNVTEYVYSAEGVKLKTTHRTIAGGIIVPYGTRHTLTQAETLAVDSITYVGNFEIDGNYCSKYYFANGYIDMGNTGSGTYHYTITDHLGNVRAVVDENGTLKQVNNYFAYGGLLNDVTTGADVQTHKYNGKELDRMHGLDMYDYGARNYDAALGLFNTMDPLCEKYYHISPYTYCGGNPVRNIDENGDSICVLIQFDGAKGFGHMGVLLQKDKNTWVYYSKNGHDHNPNVGDGGYESPEAFFEDKWGGIYDEGFVIHDGRSNEDAAVEATKEAVDEKYTRSSILVSNCAQSVQKGLRAAGVKDGSTAFVFDMVNPTSIFKAGANISTRTIPNVIYVNIIIQNHNKENRRVLPSSK